MKFIGNLLMVLYVLFRLSNKITTRIILFPKRLFCRIFICPFFKHRWVWLGNGFFGIFAPKKPFRCERCWKGHTGEMDKPFPERF